MNCSDKATQLHRLSGWERFFALVVAAGLFVFTVYLGKLQLHQITTENASDGSWKRTEAPMELSRMSLGLCVFSAVLFLYAINGLRVVRLSAGNVALDTTTNDDAKRTIDQVKSVDPTADQPIDPAVKPPESTATPSTVQTAKGPFECYKLSEVPAQVLQDAIMKWPADNIPPTDFTDFMFALRKTGRGNHPWVIKLRDRLPVVVSYGGQGKLEATITKA